MAPSHAQLVGSQFGPRAAAYVNSAVHAHGADLDHLVGLLRDHASADVLDLGCGGGHVTFHVAPHVKHVHAKDTDVDEEALYEFGTQASAFATPHRWGEWTWRYTLPGHGQARWNESFKILKDAGYKGAVSVELEDENFNTDEAGEKQGLLAGAHFLASC